MTAIIKTTYQQHEPLGANFATDLTWINQRRQELYQQYGDCVLLVYNEEVIGKGASLAEAITDAENRLNHETGVITPIVKYLSNPYRIAVYRQKKIIQKNQAQ